MEEAYITSKHPIYELDRFIKYHGRVLKKEEGVYLGWPGTAAEFCGWFEGDIIFDVDITFHPYMDEGRIYPLFFYTEIDGALTKIGPIDESEKQIKISGLAREYHTIKLMKANQAQMSTVILSAITYSGEIDLKPCDKPFRLECIGDSINCGEAMMYNLSDKYSDTPFFKIFESSEIAHAYQSQLAKILDADITNVCCGGWGVDCCEWNYGETIPSIYDYTCWFDDKTEKWDHSSFEPDVIVVGLGENDPGYNVPEDRFKKGVKAFLDHLLDIHPNAYIVWVYGMVYGYYADWLASVISDYNDTRVKFYLMNRNIDGGFEHPSLEGHTRFAKTLARIIREKFN